MYLAGQVARDGSTSVKAQTEQILKQIDELLRAAGTSKSKLLSATIYLASIATFKEMNAVWDAWVDPRNTPARATVEAKLAAPQYLVEIMVTAAIYFGGVNSRLPLWGERGGGPVSDPCGTHRPARLPSKKRARNARFCQSVGSSTGPPPRSPHSTSRNVRPFDF